MVICSGMLLSLNRTLASSTGCTVKHWMSAGVKEPQGLRGWGWGCRGEGMGVCRRCCGTRVGMRSQGAARPLPVPTLPGYTAPGSQ